MQWKNWGVNGSVALLLMAATVGCMPAQPVTPDAVDATTEMNTEATPEPVTDATTEATVEAMPEVTTESTTATTPEAPVEPTVEPPAEPVAEATLASGSGTITDTASAPETYEDPFAYCAAVGTIDAPDARYTGEPMPDVIGEGLRDAFNAPGTSLDVFLRGSYWRCMDGEVYACNVGANLPCTSKADLSQEPSEGMVEFCEANANSDYIPAYVTGRSTIYNWRCDETTPVVADQMTDVDSQGFLNFVWHELTPPQ